MVLTPKTSYCVLAFSKVNSRHIVVGDGGGVISLHRLRTTYSACTALYAAVAAS